MMLVASKYEKLPVALHFFCRLWNIAEMKFSWRKAFVSKQLYQFLQVLYKLFLAAKNIQYNIVWGCTTHNNLEVRSLF